VKQLKISGLALMATLALSVVVVSSAEAAEYGKCERVKPETGGYTTENCKTTSSTHKGLYEWVPITATAHVTFTEKAGSFKIATGFTPIICGKLGSATTVEGVITGPKTAEETLTSRECEGGGLWATTEGQPNGTIKTHRLITTLIGHGEKVNGAEPKPEEAWLQTKAAEHEPSVVTFRLGGSEPFEITGSYSGKTGKTNEMTKLMSTSLQRELENLVLEGAAVHFEAGEFATNYSTAVEIKA
jgi:hypothetical protein